MVQELGLTKSVLPMARLSDFQMPEQLKVHKSRLK